MTGPRATRVRVGRAGDGVCVTEMAPGDLLTPRLLARCGRHARIALVGHQAMLLAGDRLELDVQVGAGAHLELVEPAGTVAYNARGGRAGWSARVRVGAGAGLTWRSAPFVVAGGADVERDLDVALNESGVAAFRETLVLGRHGEDGGSLLSRQRATLGGVPLLVETLDLRDPEARALPGVLGPHRVVATAMVLGLSTDTDVRSGMTPLAGPGVLARALTGAVHEADHILAGTWSTWSGEVAGHFAARRQAGPRATAPTHRSPRVSI